MDRPGSELTRAFGAVKAPAHSAGDGGLRAYVYSRAANQNRGQELGRWRASVGLRDFAVRCLVKVTPRSVRRRLRAMPKGARVGKLEHDVLQLSMDVRRLEQRLTGDGANAVSSGPSAGVCKHADFLTDWYRRRHEAMSGPWRPESLHDYQYTRKSWEWCVIAELLDRHGVLSDGRTGIGFAVGKEPLASVFARAGAQVLATDLAASDSGSQRWAMTDQHAAGVDALWHSKIVDRDLFTERVRFAHADMRDLSTLAGEGPVDFIWSSCALEHLGSLGAGIEFVLESAKLLRPGGLAVHTTEFNVSSTLDTVETGGNVLYRESDIGDLAERLRAAGYRLRPIEFDIGDHEFDRRYDVEPFFTTAGGQHIKLLLEGHITTLLVLTIDAPA